jgi:hypothetical protein
MQQLSALVDEIVTYVGVAGLDSLAQQLSIHIIPMPGASAQEWQQYADALFAILYDQRALGHPWSLQPEDIDKLKDYFYANDLLVQCLKVATVSDRQAILNKLLLPPRRERKTEVKGKNQA